MSAAAVNGGRSTTTAHCDACLDNAFDLEDPHAIADHGFVYSDEATAESEYLNEKARELGFPFEEQNLDALPGDPLAEAGSE